MRRAAGLAAATCVAWGTLLACADAAPGRDAPPPVGAAAPTPEPPAAPVPSGAEAGRGSGCIRGGSTREEVLELMGRPDSVVFGAYVYGRSQILFGYGVVVEWSNEGGNLVLC